MSTKENYQFAIHSLSWARWVWKDTERQHHCYYSYHSQWDHYDHNKQEYTKRQKGIQNSLSVTDCSLSTSHTNRMNNICVKFAFIVYIKNTSVHIQLCWSGPYGFFIWCLTTCQYKFMSSIQLTLTTNVQAYSTTVRAHLHVLAFVFSSSSRSNNFWWDYRDQVQHKNLQGHESARQSIKTSPTMISQMHRTAFFMRIQEEIWMHSTAFFLRIQEEIWFNSTKKDWEKHCF